MSGEDEFSELGWIVECDGCHHKQELAPQSKHMAVMAALAQGWTVKVKQFGPIELALGHFCSQQCVEAKK